MRLSAGSDVVVITSGVPRKPGMSRDDLLSVNYKIMQDVTANVMKHSPDAILIVVANPLDAMAQAVYRLSGLPRERVIGMAGVLDSARMRAFIATELNVSVENVTRSSSAVTATRWCRCRATRRSPGIPITELLSAERIAAICDRTANGGAEITKLVGTSAWYAPGQSSARMVEAILKDKKLIEPCSVYLQGEYGVNDQFLGVPVKLGAKGVEQIIQITLYGRREGRARQVRRRREGTHRPSSASRGSRPSSFGRRPSTLTGYGLHRTEGRLRQSGTAPWFSKAEGRLAKPTKAESGER